MSEWTDYDADTWTDARTREIERMTPEQCRAMLRKLANVFAWHADRREAWAEVYWEVTTP